MKKNAIFCLIFFSSLAYSQIGINTTNPQGTFHIDGAKDNPLTGAPDANQQVNDIVVTSAGNLGVGLISAAYKFDVLAPASNGDIIGMRLRGNSTTASTGQSMLIGFHPNILVGGNAPWGIGAQFFSAAGGQGDVDFIFKSSNGGGFIDRFIIKNNGNVGIATTNPLGVFHIDGAKDNPVTGSPDTAQQVNDVVVTSAGNVGIGITVPTAKLEVAGGVNLPVVAQTPVAGPYSAVGVNINTGALGTFTPLSSPIAVIKSSYNSYPPAGSTSNSFELTSNTTTVVNTLGVTITDDAVNGDFITLPSAGIYRIDSNWSQGSAAVTTNGQWLNVLTEPAIGGTITSFDRIYVGASNNSNTQAYLASFVIEVTEPTRIYLRAEAQSAITIRRAVFNSPPVYTLAVVITKI